MGSLDDLCYYFDDNENNEVHNPGRKKRKDFQERGAFAGRGDRRGRGRGPRERRGGASCDRQRMREDAIAGHPNRRQNYSTRERDFGTEGLTTEERGWRNVRGRGNNSFKTETGLGSRINYAGRGFSPRIGEAGNDFGPRISDARRAFGPRISDAGRGFGPRISDARRGFDPRINDARRGFGSRINDAGRGLGPRISDAGRGLGPRISEPERGYSQTIHHGRMGTSSRRELKTSGNTRNSYYQHRFQVKDYMDVESKDINQVTLKLASDIDKLEGFINSEKMSHADTNTLVGLLAKISTCDLHRESVLNILNVVCTSRFLDTHVLQLLNSVDCGQYAREENIVKLVQMLHTLLFNICQRLPSYASKVHNLLQCVVAMKYRAASHERGFNVGEAFHDLLQESRRYSMKSHEELERKYSEQRNDRWKNGPVDDDEMPPEDFEELSVFPDDNCMDLSEKPFLRANKKEGAFKDPNHYLDVQFRLLREDYIRPLRDGIREYRSMLEKGENVHKNKDLRIYHRVQIICFVCKESLEHRIKFDNSHFKNMRWKSSKRLLYGSLVCLSSDNFETIYYAVVTSREIKDLEKGEIIICFEKGLDDIIGKAESNVFTMAETTAYFEVYRHVLEGMKEMKSRFVKDVIGVKKRYSELKLEYADAAFPMARYIVRCSKTIEPPAYLCDVLRSASAMNLQAIMREGRKQAYNYGHNSPSWPALEDTIFDSSQYEAVKTALTKELAIIQGPPGTGKTFVGLKVAKLLYDNRAIWSGREGSRPILVVCYTNHALDQFLEGILQFCPTGIVRVGSRCKIPELERFNLKQIRASRRKEKAVQFLLHNSIGECFKELCELRRKLEAVSAKLKALTKGIISEKTLQKFMSPQQYKYLTQRFTGNIGRGHVMLDWLTEGMTVVEDGSGNDSYAQLVQEMTSLILQGSDSRSSAGIDVQSLQTLHPKVRVQLYRFWVERFVKNLQMDTKLTEEEKRSLQKKAQTEILPDQLLQPVMDKKIYSSIAASTSPKPDVGLTFGVRTWLGIEINSRNVQGIQNILSQLQEEDEEEDDLNIEEDAELLQRERHLDDADDDHDLFDSGVQATKYSVENAMEELGVIPTKGRKLVAEPDGVEGGWTIPAQQRKQKSRRLQHLLNSADPMTKQHADRVFDVWRLSVDERVRLYLFWKQSYESDLKANVKKEAFDYASVARRMRELRFGEDLEVLRWARFIGMTTTGAARYRRVLADVGCPIVLVEEAAEVLEAHVVTTLHKQCRHLILIGDHQQLRPSPTVYELCIRYNLDLSLFERLVKNNLPHSTLAVQHRMCPDVARLVRHVYPHLLDHETTLGRENIRGMKSNVFLVHHEVTEKDNAETKSKSNDHEAELCVGLCRYLLQQGYPSSSITILTAYSGQVLAVKMLMKKQISLFQGVRVVAVDNYQGEENDIIILSLVRSNDQGKVGFLETDNRICVAISRARNGLYALGNFKILAEKSELWTNICKTAKANDQLSDALVLRCANHPETEIRVTCAKDFDNAPEGGCQKPCTHRLERCGHVCERLCHINDREHVDYKCKKRCEKIICSDGHQCTRNCSERCGKCRVLVPKLHPSCGHEAKVECSQELREWQCRKRCESYLSCGHQCSGNCGECRIKCDHVSKCSEKVKRERPCGHVIMTLCSASLEEQPCREHCQVTLDCGHTCSGSCWECLTGHVHKSCSSKCPKSLASCGHKCALTCGIPCGPCNKKKCPTACAHVKCSQPCAIPCPPCSKPCPWTCEHKPCKALCCDPCQPCNNPCSKQLPCGHACCGFCGEKKCVCYQCESSMFVSLAVPDGRPDDDSLKIDSNTLFVKLPNCGHIFSADALDAYVRVTIPTLLSGYSLPCPAKKCKKRMREWECWRYHQQLRAHQDCLQEVKKRVVAEALVPDLVHRKYRIEKSIDILTRDVEMKEKLSSRVWRDLLARGDMDANTAFALTCQIKVAWLVERVIRLLCEFQINGTYLRVLKETASIEREAIGLRKILQQPLRLLTSQRHRELIQESRRLLNLSLLNCAHLLYQQNPDVKRDVSQVQSFMAALSGKEKVLIPDSGIDYLFEECGKIFPEFKTVMMNFINPSVVDIPTNQDLCEFVEKVKTAAMVEEI